MRWERPSDSLERAGATASISSMNTCAAERGRGRGRDERTTLSRAGHRNRILRSIIPSDVQSFLANPQVTAAASSCVGALTLISSLNTCEHVMNGAESADSFRKP